jgi:protocatechuate 3,4-dioxygenase beta subunit
VVARRRARHEGRAAVPAAVQPVDRMTGRELLDALDAELDRLPPAYREPLVLCYLEGLTRDEAALRLGLPPATLKSRLERGRKRLGAALTKRGCVLGAGLLALAATSPAGASPPRLVEGVLAAASGRVPASVAALAGGGLRGVLTHRPLAALAVLAGTAALGLGLLSAGLPAAGPPREPAGEAAAAEPPKAKMPAPADAMPAPGAKAADKPRPPADRPLSRTIVGRVVGPDGKPVAGAKLFVPGMHTRDDKTPVTVEVRPDATADAEGRFTVAVTQIIKDFPLLLVASAPGFGVDWVQFGGPTDPELPAELTLRLTKDVPISGRVVNTEGRPVPGVAVTAFVVFAPADEKLDNYLAEWRRDVRNTLGKLQKTLYVRPGDLPGEMGRPMTTDPDGRFTVRGAGAERIVGLRFAEGGIARSMVQVVTRAGFDPKPYEETLRRRENEDLRVYNHLRAFYPTDFTFVAEPGKEIAGTVTDAATGEPIAGCRVSTTVALGERVDAVTDASGRYRLAGVPRSEWGHFVSVTASPPYLWLNPRVADTEAFAPIRLDVRLAKGVNVTGRVIDRQTGKGVEATVRFAPLPDNKLYGSKPGFAAYATDRSGCRTGREGRFQLTTLPGPSLAIAQVIDGEMLNGQRISPYRTATPDPDHKDLFRRNGDSWAVATAANGTEFLRNENVVKVIDVKASGEAVDLFVDRGMTAKITVADADGRPLAGARVSGLAEHWPIAFRLDGPSATVYALDPAKPRALAFYHPEKRLGGTATVRGDEKEPVVVKLGPLARLTGRLLDTDGQPLAGAEVSLGTNRVIDGELYRFATPAGARAVTDKDGRFTLDDAVPGIWFYLQIRKGKYYYRPKPTLWERQFKPGQTVDLGDRTVASGQ